MPTPKKLPLRMCLACRESKNKKDMLRVVRNAEGEIKLDFSGKMPGRGSYLCDREECVRKLVKYKLINKAFSCEVPDEVYARIEEEFFGKK